MSVSIPWPPVAPSTKVGYTVSSVLLFAEAVTSVAVAAVVAEVALPLRAPVTCVVVKIPELGL